MSIHTRVRNELRWLYLLALAYANFHVICMQAFIHSKPPVHALALLALKAAQGKQPLSQHPASAGMIHWTCSHSKRSLLCCLRWIDFFVNYSVTTWSTASANKLLMQLLPPNH
jgi:hypothetical protein